jgi:hypothetical protein
MMIEIKNLQFQPLTFHLAGKKTIHLGPRELVAIATKEMSDEIRLAERRGLIATKKMATKKEKK